jgi:hypothetical protein
MSNDDTPRAGAGADAGRLVTTWRTVQKLDARAWQQLREDAPLRFTRWLLTLALVCASWAVLGIPHTSSAWLPVLGIGVLLLLPDASKITLFGVSYEARQAAAEARHDAERAQEILLTVNVGTQAGEVAVESARARQERTEPAPEAMQEFL